MFLSRITAFIWAYAVMNPGVNALRTPVYAEMVNIVNGKEVTFEDYKFDMTQVTNTFNNYGFSNNRTITKSMLTWWEFHNDKQELLSLESIFEIEHIFPKKRQENENSLSNPKNLESLGNKAVLEKRINIRASDYRFQDKKKYYLGFENARKQKREGTKNRELIEMANNKNDFTETDIVQRTSSIILEFTSFMKKNGLIEV